MKYSTRATLVCVALMAVVQVQATAQDHGSHRMWQRDVAGGWVLSGMAQVYPAATFVDPGGAGPLRRTGVYLTQPALMANLERADGRVALRTTLNFEGLVQPDGELTPGGWGEGFIDSRHPHTFVHEAMLSVNIFDVPGGAASLSAGRGFAPYGTDDPMSRPALKYPTNHHLSQILERWTINGVVAWPRLSLEAGVFAGAEPEGPWDFANFEGFGDSWSARATGRLSTGPQHGVEASFSLASVSERHHEESATTQLWNVALRWGGAHSMGATYALVEYSESEPEHGTGHFSALAEGRVERGVHAPYVRLEYATRPEYPRDGAGGSDDFFRYDHDSHAIGASRWTIGTFGYGLLAELSGIAVQPFAEAQWHHVSLEDGPAALEPDALFGKNSFGALSVGVRLYFGGTSMRMGSYGVLDAMTGMRRALQGGAAAPHHAH